MGFGLVGAKKPTAHNIFLQDYLRLPYTPFHRVSGDPSPILCAIAAHAALARSLPLPHLVVRLARLGVHGPHKYKDLGATPRGSRIKRTP